MSFSQNITNINNGITNINDIGIAIAKIPFDSVWSGPSYTKLTTDLNIALTNMNTVKENFESFKTGLDKLEKYKENDEKIALLRTEVLNLTQSKKNDENNSTIDGQIASKNSEIRILQNDNEKLKSEIKGIMASISPINNSVFQITFKMTEKIDYNFEVNELLARYNGTSPDGTLVKLNDYGSLYKYYDQYDAEGNLIVSGQDYVEGLILDVQTQYTGREAAVNSALLILQLAADKGIKLDYEHKGTMASVPYVPTSEVASGVDCNPFTSWVVDKGTPNGFQWRSVGEFSDVGQTIPYENWTNAKPGDVFYYANEDGTGHVGVIIENNPETGEFICAEARGSTIGIVLQTRSYKSLEEEGYNIQDMTTVYDGTENTDRKVFDNYVDWDTYVKKP